MAGRVLFGVPVYRGERYLAETLASIQAQTYRNFEVLISIDGPDPVCEAVCEPFLRDSRFRLVVQPQRLGWVGNLGWLMSQATGDFWCFQQQDDLIAPTYLETLVQHACANPSAALVYCDLIPFGAIEGHFTPVPSVLGASALMRQLTMLVEHFPAVAFRGLTRAEALRQAGPMPGNDCQDFGADTTWLASIARSGELHRVPHELYRKRYHDRNTQSAWWAWPRVTRLRAWACHCLEMLNQALAIDCNVAEYRLLWLAAIQRLTSPRTAGYFLPIAELTPAERRGLLVDFLHRARAGQRYDYATLLDIPPRDLEQWSTGYFWLPPTRPVRIVGFGPNPVFRGRPYNQQPDGSSALWVQTERLVEEGTRIRVGTVDLETVQKGTILTARIPAHLTSKAGALPVLLVGPRGEVRSRSVSLKVLEPTGRKAA